MKRKILITTATWLLIFLALTIGAVQTFAQQPAPTPEPSSPPPISIPDLERRIYQHEIEQAQAIESLKSSIQSNQTIQIIIMVIGGFFAILVGAQTVVQSFVTIKQWYREGERGEIENAGVRQVNAVMGIIQQTLQSRLTEEEKAWQRAKDAEDRLKKFEDKVGFLDQFYQNFQDTLKNSTREIEEAALVLAKIPRHDFRGKAAKLDDFVRQLDKFEIGFAAFGAKQRFSDPRIPYVRGVAAHYNNRPETAKLYLEEVVRSGQTKQDEDDKPERRLANAYYYLGLIQSNFGNYQGAIDYFEEANRLDPKSTDFLTRIVTAEAHVMRDNYERAVEFITEVVEGAQERIEAGQLSPYRRLQSRAILIRANMAILRRGGDWHQEVQQLLEPVREADPAYYYATATLAQVYHDQGNRDGAQELFEQAFNHIERIFHLNKVTETRSRILLLMTAGLCGKHSAEGENNPEIRRKSEGFLYEAEGLRSDLPKIDTQVCTVFSILSKRNESVETIHRHIELIQEGQVLTR